MLLHHITVKYDVDSESTRMSSKRLCMHVWKMDDIVFITEHECLDIWHMMFIFLTPERINSTLRIKLNMICNGKKCILVGEDSKGYINKHGIKPLACWNSFWCIFQTDSKHQQRMKQFWNICEQFSETSECVLLRLTAGRVELRNRSTSFVYIVAQGMHYTLTGSWKESLRYHGRNGLRSVYYIEHTYTFFTPCIYYP